jgi:16S rRNA (guanine527-N7)-methyltransferase
MDRQTLAAAGFELEDQEFARLDTFVTRLLDENTRINLTATRDPDEFWKLHICDSLALLPLIGEQQPRTLLDVGSGGGLPGIPLACVCPQLEVTLLDARQKKLDAITRIIEPLGLQNVRVCWARAEDRAHDPDAREHFDAVTIRAVGDLRTAVEYVAGFVRPGGHAWFFHSTRELDETLSRAARAANRCRLSLIESRLYHLPEPHGERAIVVGRKDRVLPASLPRRQGRPKSDPL